MTPHAFTRWLDAPPPRRTLLMGVLNVTPDSFSDGGRFMTPDDSVQQVRHLAAGGADLIDVGGESTRPGSDPVDEATQTRRILPAIRAAVEMGVAVSVDTTRAAVAAAALDAGACLINDVSAGTDDPAMLPRAASAGCAIVLMHMRGRPKTMQQAPTYADVVSEVRDFLLSRAAAAEACGVDERRILLDLGIGFGKSTTHNLDLLRHLEVFTSLPYPHLVGVSRKRFLGEIAGDAAAAADPSARDVATAAAVAWCVGRGAAVVRVHDITRMRQVVRVTATLANPSRDDGPWRDDGPSPAHPS